MPTVTCFMAAHTSSRYSASTADFVASIYISFSYLRRLYEEFRVYQVEQRRQIVSQLCRINSQLFKYGNGLSEKSSVFVGIGKYKYGFKNSNKGFK